MVIVLRITFFRSTFSIAELYSNEPNLGFSSSGMRRKFRRRSPPEFSYGNLRTSRFKTENECHYCKDASDILCWRTRTRCHLQDIGLCDQCEGQKRSDRYRYGYFQRSCEIYRWVEFHFNVLIIFTKKPLRILLIWKKKL